MILIPTLAGAQELEPRAYSNSPVGLNFFIAGYAYSKGGFSTDPSIPMEDAQLKTHTGVLAYARSLDLWGMSGKFDMILPYSRLSGTALLAGEPKERDVSGFSDPKFRLSVNFYGAPALSMQEFAAYQQDLVVGASVQVSAPGGQYDSSKAVNLATNRWSLKPDIGFSKSFGSLTLDLTTGVTFYSNNDDYYGGQTREQEPIYSVQTNLSYNFSRGAWASLGVTYYRGGATTVNGVRNDDALGNSRTGAILALPVDRYQSIKLSASSGISTRVGTSFDTVGIFWQYRWGAGL
ncbi:MAG: hypothetical protein AMJ84_00535 [Acidithiobacillales bacterium SM23_46]|nr:MAG: hypothetical protein AMS22_15810 [Thiotrichales bacterium SG8_50]KPK74165.1 MAG: hypothetical protein AMJ84_00535 [Acidithiobacillales bacterium SM23_46]KPL28712.1 MAG: hypothetical protein AMJ72_01875 [Acidithiobacillales bacterium SM1_46]